MVVGGEGGVGCRRENCGFHLLGLEFVGIELRELKWISEFLLKHLYPFPKILDLRLDGGGDHAVAGFYFFT